MRKKVLVVGDVILDHYVYMKSERMSAEAPIPVYLGSEEEVRLGGAANVAANLASLSKDESIDVYLAGISSVSAEKMIVRAGVKSLLLTIPDQDAIVKKRYVDSSDMKYVMRIDSAKNVENFHSLALYEMLSTRIAECREFDYVVVSDYNIGTITDELAAFLLELGRPILVDSKRRDLRIYSGSYLLKVNESEYDVQIASKDYPCVESLFKHVVITRGSKGADLSICTSFDHNKKSYRLDKENFPVSLVKPVDVTGCGDTFLAGLTYFLVSKTNDLRTAIRFGNICASAVVKQFGTSIVRLS